MTVFVIVLLILLGLFLLVLEFLIFPGITVAGVGGVLFTGVGVYLAYQDYGNVAGNLTLGATLLFSLFVVLWALRSGTWNKVMLTSKVSGTVGEVDGLSIKVGDEGEAVTRLNPVGKVMVNNELVEAHCPGHFVDEHTSVIVTKVFNTYINVKPQK